MGVNGAGKSTLVKAISGHYDTDITSGTITYNGKEIYSSYDHLMKKLMKEYF